MTPRTISFPKAEPLIREKSAAPRRLRPDGTEEIVAEDIMLIVPKVSPPPTIEKQAIEELSDADLVMQGGPSVSVHATEEILESDVLEVAAAAARLDTPRHRLEIPSPLPWTIDAAERPEFPTPQEFTVPYPAVRPRVTTYSDAEVDRRRFANLKIVVASLSFAAALVLVGGIARLVPASGSEGPVGIAFQTPKKLVPSVRVSSLVYGTAPPVQQTAAVSVDALPSVPRHHRGHR